MVAHGDHLGAVLPIVTCDQLRTVCIHLPNYLADRPPIWMARAGRGGARRGGHRRAAELVVYGEVPGVGRLRARCRTSLAISATYAVMVVLGQGG